MCACVPLLCLNRSRVHNDINAIELWLFGRAYMMCMCISTYYVCGSTCVLCCVAVLCTAVREHCHCPFGGGATKAEVSERGFRVYVYVQEHVACLHWALDMCMHEVCVCVCVCVHACMRACE